MSTPSRADLGTRVRRLCAPLSEPQLRIVFAAVDVLTCTENRRAAGAQGRQGGNGAARARLGRRARAARGRGGGGAKVGRGARPPASCPCMAPLAQKGAPQAPQPRRQVHPAPRASLAAAANAQGRVPRGAGDACDTAEPQHSSRATAAGGGAPAAARNRGGRRRCVLRSLPRTPEGRCAPALQTPQPVRALRCRRADVSHVPWSGSGYDVCVRLEGRASPPTRVPKRDVLPTV